ncbi:hypothetical protein ABIF74_000276 [Bradyrhizobium japonicum]
MPAFAGHTTGRAVFPHSAFRQVSSQGARRRHFAHAVQHKYARVPIDLIREPSDATSWRLMSSAQKGEHAVKDVSINGLMSRSKRAIAEVSGPAAQKAVQSCLYFGPSALVARRQQFADLPLDPQHAFLRRSRAKIPPPPIAEVAGSERVPKEVKAVQSGILHRGFSLVECQPKRAGPGCLDSAPLDLSGFLPGYAERGALRFCRCVGRA